MVIAPLCFLSSYAQFEFAGNKPLAQSAAHTRKSSPFSNTRIHFMQPLKERLVREVGYGLSLEGASAADLVKSMQAKS